MKQNIVLEKSFNFALRIVRVYRYLTKNKHEYVLSNQLLRSGTSIGANIEEAVGAQSRKDFFSKLTIAYKEARETKYWLHLLSLGEFFTEKEYNSLLSDIDELLKIICSIQKTIKRQNDISNL